MKSRAMSQPAVPPGAPPLEVTVCATVCELVKAEFVWRIHQYELVQGPRSLLESATFSATDKGQIFMTWSLILDDEGILLRQHFPAKRTASRAVRVKTSFANGKNKNVCSQKTIVREDTAMPARVNSRSRENLLSNGLVVDGKLTISCQIETYKDQENRTGQAAKGFSQLFSKKGELLKDFEKLFENIIHCDVIFNVGDQQFPAHKDILAARSPIFAAMFKHSTKENLSGEVDVPDIESNVFKELLRYIYTGEVPLERMDAVAAGLLAAADKYLLEKLKKACADHLINEMSPENCVKLLSLGENDPAYCLREKAIDYVRQYPAEVTATDSWKKANEEKAEWFLNIKDMLFESFVGKRRKVENRE